MMASGKEHPTSYLLSRAVYQEKLGGVAKINVFRLQNDVPQL
jgi:hypothetical protein